jgi:SulP family sulfate permease
MDRLTGTEFLAHLSGQIHLSQHQAMLAIAERRLAAPTDAGRPLREVTEIKNTPPAVR